MLVIFSTVMTSCNVVAAVPASAVAVTVPATVNCEFLRAGVLSELAIELEDPLVGHRLEQQIGQRPYQGIDPVGRSPRAQVDFVAARGRKAAHLILELRKGADVVNPALLIERRHGLGPGNLAA